MKISPQLFDRTIKAILSSSRTAKGISNTQSSKDKQKLLKSSSTLTVESENNVRELLTLFCNLIDQRFTITPSQIFTTLCDAAHIINKNMGDQHKDIWRTWKGKHPEHLSLEKIATNLENEFSLWLYDALTNLTAGNVINTAAETEIKFNGEIRPFVDGCGRISRTLAAAILIQYSLLTPHCTSEGDEEYYKDFRPPWNTWKTWYKSKILPFKP